MAISIIVSPQGSSETEIQDTVRTSRIVNAVITAETDEETEEIVLVSAQIMQNEPNVLITSSNTFVSITGRYRDPFLDVFQYVEKGSSDKLETPKSVIGVENLPPNKDFFRLNQDISNESIRNYTITVKTNVGQEIFPITHKIINELDAIKSFVSEYYG
jgi:hypothetical protein